MPGTPFVRTRTQNTGIISRQTRYSVTHRIFMDVTQAAEIGLLVGHARIPELKPDHSSWRVIQCIYFSRCNGVKMLQERANPSRTVRHAHKMIVVRKNRPGLNRDSVFGCEPLETAQQQIESSARPEKRLFQIRRGRDHESSRSIEPVSRAMWPVGHGVVLLNCALRNSVRAAEGRFGSARACSRFRPPARQRSPRILPCYTRNHRLDRLREGGPRRSASSAHAIKIKRVAASTDRGCGPRLRASVPRPPPAPT